jgi:hypothetical protein
MAKHRDNIIAIKGEVRTPVGRQERLKSRQQTFAFCAPPGTRFFRLARRVLKI